MKKAIRVTCNIILVILAYYLYINQLFGKSKEVLYSTYSFFSLPIVIGFVLLLEDAWKKYRGLTKRKWIFICLSVILGIFLSFGNVLVAEGSVTLSSKKVWITAIILAYVLWGIVIEMCVSVIPFLSKVLFETNHPKLDHIVSKFHFVTIWILIFLCWIPYFLACFPGIHSYDAKFQCSQIDETLSLTAHHPIVHTFLLGGSVYFGKTVLHSSALGMAIYSLIQMLVNSAIFAYVISFMKREKVSSPVVCLCACFYALMPFNGIFSVCATKDVIFGSLFLLFTVNIYKALMHPEIFFKGYKNIISFTFFTFVLLSFRNNMVYAYIAAFPFLLFVFRKKWKSFILLFGLPIVALELYKGIAYPLLDVEPGDSREKYSVIMQQYGMVYNHCELEFSEKALLLRIMDDESWKLYSPNKSDAIKDHFETAVFEENLSEYMKLWVSLGMKYPSYYANAFFRLTCSYWYPSDQLPDETTYRKYIEVYCNGDFPFSSKLPMLLKVIEKFSMESVYEAIPGISMIFSPAIYIWIFLYLAATAFYEKNRNVLLLLFLPFLYFLTLLLGPVALLRYIYAIILIVPFIIGIKRQTKCESE